MNDTQKILFAKNELENVIGSLKSQIAMSEDDMMLVLELLLSTARYRSMVQSAYDQIDLVKQNKVKVEKVEPAKEEEGDN